MHRRFLDTPDGQIHYVTAGAGRPVLLLHQTPRSWDEYREVIPILARERRVIAMDTIGYGESYKPDRRCDIEDYARGAVALVDGLGIGSIRCRRPPYGRRDRDGAGGVPSGSRRAAGPLLVPLRGLGRPRPAPPHRRTPRRPRRGEAGRHPPGRALADPAELLSEGPARPPDALPGRRAPGRGEDPRGPRRLQPVPDGGEDRPDPLPDARDVGDGGPVRVAAGRGGRPSHPGEPARADRRGLGRARGRDAGRLRHASCVEFLRG